MYGERLNQLDTRFSKDFRLGGARVFRANLDIYNILNSNPVRAVNSAYASWPSRRRSWIRACSKISVQFDF